MQRLDTALWRAVSAYRVAALLYATGSVFAHLDDYHRDGLALSILGGMALWTAFMVFGPSPGRRVLVVDLLAGLGAQQATVLVLSHEAIQRGEPTLAVSWAAAPVLAWAVRGGWRAGGVAAAVIAVGAVVERQGASQQTVNSCVLLLLVGLVVGYLVDLSRRAEASYAEAVRLQAETAERERLAREVHDGVLQALALVARRSDDPQLVQLVIGQEQALRRLVAGPALAPAGESDLRSLLPARPGVEVAAPADPVTLPAQVATELAAAVAAAVDNALQHGATTAWLLVEDEPEAVTVSVRDDGPGIPPGRLEEASRAGRLGVACSIRGRVEDLGGTVTITSTPDQGTEVEMRVAR